MDYALCDCCAIMVANNDESSCRDYYGHTHPTVTENFVLSGESFENPSVGFDCDGCKEWQEEFATLHFATIA